MLEVWFVSGCCLTVEDDRCRVTRLSHLSSKRVTCGSWSDTGGMSMAQKIAVNSVGVPRTCLAVTLYADATGHDTIAWGNCKLVQACFSPVVWCQGRCKGEYTDVGDRSLFGSLATCCGNDISWYHWPAKRAPVADQFNYWIGRGLGHTAAVRSAAQVALLLA